MLTTPFNRCNHPPWVLSSLEYQDNPQPIELGDVGYTDRRLFLALNQLSGSLSRGLYFHDYVSVKFRLHEWPDHLGQARASLRHSYVRFLHAWGADSNGHAGAVLKAWVESRFGIPATYHRGVLRDNRAAQTAYACDRMKGSAQTMGLPMQLDLLYTFCQQELHRRYPGSRWLTLYRGTHDPEEYILDPEHGPEVVRLNNLSSFTSDSEVAWEFGSSVWEVRVPIPKILFFSGLLPQHILGGEKEFLVVGGLYRVRTLCF